VVLVGDAAGWNDPIIGLGLSITYRDVRIVSDLLKASDDWAALSFAGYGEERAERMRRLRFAASLQSAIDMEFGEAARARRRSLFDRAKIDPNLRAHAFAVMAGPETLPPAIFTEEHRARVLGA
jgi:2-polyprenyl-6-methoxyphenol hydroxylase-like FAD-dependent oxidoreductase